jgi:hypothetical protein
VKNGRNFLESLFVGFLVTLTVLLVLSVCNAVDKPEPYQAPPDCEFLDLFGNCIVSNECVFGCEYIHYGPPPVEPVRMPR